MTSSDIKRLRTFPVLLHRGEEVAVETHGWSEDHGASTLTFNADNLIFWRTFNELHPQREKATGDHMKESLDPTTGICVCVCDSWDDFISAMRSGKPGSDRLYRGQASRDWKLSSEFERRMEKVADPPDAERLRTIYAGHLSAFQELAAGLLGMEARTFEEDDWWALGRHHGLNTPLLDWSRIPYVAAYFAFSEHLRLKDAGVDVGEAVTVWALADWDALARPGEFELVEPRSFSNPRQRAQRGVFTRLTHSEHIDIESYLAARGLADRLTRWEIPASEAVMALDDLLMTNITPSTLFPDLGGAAAEVNMVQDRLIEAT